MRSPRPVVLVPAPIHPVGIDLLAEVFDVVEVDHLAIGEQDLAAALAESDAVIVRSAPITATALAKSSRLKVIAKHGAGLDSIDVDAATALGILVTNTGGSNAASVAEHAVTLMLAILHDVPAVDRNVRYGAYTHPGQVVLGDLSDARVGLVGFGSIARRVAGICRLGFGASVASFDPFVSEEEMAALGVEKVDELHALLASSDVVSLHAPLTPQTYHLIGSEELELMRSDAVLVNTARGGVVDEAALIQALDNGHLRGAGLDVLEEEPPTIANPLFASARVVLSPHIGGGSESARRLTALAAAQAAIDVVEGRRPMHIVNPDALRHSRLKLEGEGQ